MAGPMVGPLLEGLGLDLVTAYWTPDGEFPDHEPNPLLPENREFIMGKVVEEQADLGIAWDGDADRCFFIDDRGTFVDGDFLTALLAESLLRKSPGEAILYDVRASRAVADTVKAAGGTAHPNRVGHAFFKTRMRDEGAMFGGEVSGHYYFRDFYCADSGTIPALLILELLSVEDAKLSELLERYRSTYFISGEINSEVEDAPAKMAEIEERYGDASIDHLDGVSVDYDDWHFNVRSSNTEPLLRLCLESLVSQRGHGAPPRRGAGDHPLVSDAADALARAAGAGIHRLAIPTPFQVGLVNTYLIEDDPLTLLDSGPNSGTALDALEQALARHGHRVEDLELIVISHQHMDHLGLVSILARRSGAQVAALDLLAPWAAQYDDGMQADDAFANSVMTEHGIPEDIRLALLAVSQSYRNWGASATVTRPLAAGSELVLRDRTLRVLHRPGHSPSDTIFHDAERRIVLGADHVIGHISSNPLISRPLDAPLDDDPPPERPHALVTYLDSLRATRAMEDVDIILPGHGEPVTDHVTLIDERFRMHKRRAEKIAPPDRGAAADRVRDRAGAVGHGRGDAGVPHAVGGARPRGPARRRRPRRRGARRRRGALRRGVASAA